MACSVSTAIFEKQKNKKKSTAVAGSAGFGEACGKRVDMASCSSWLGVKADAAMGMILGASILFKDC